MVYHGAAGRFRILGNDCITDGCVVDINHAVHVTPDAFQYRRKLTVLTNQGNLPPAKTVFDEEGRRGENISSYVCGGCITSGSTVRRSIIGPRCKINSFSLVEDSILFNNVEIGRHVKIRRAIIDEDLRIPEGTEIGYDHEADRARGYTVTESGITVIAKGEDLERFA